MDAYRARAESKTVVSAAMTSFWPGGGTISGGKSFRIGPGTTSAKMGSI